MDKGHLLLPLPGCGGLIICAVSDDRSALTRFGEVFSNVWLKIPKLDQDEIGAYWDKKRSVARPCAILDDPWFGEEGVQACCIESGLVMKFDWRLFRLLPDREAQTLIAHEMAHVHQWATGKHQMALTNADLTGSIGDIVTSLITQVGRVELHADERVKAWGLNPIDASAWLIQHTQVEDGEIVLRQKPVTKKYARSEAKSRRWRRYHGF